MVAGVQGMLAFLILISLSQLTGPISELYRQQGCVEDIREMETTS